MGSKVGDGRGLLVFMVEFVLCVATTTRLSIRNPALFVKRSYSY